MLVGELLDGLQVARRRRDDGLGHRVADRRDDDAGDVAGALGQDPLEVGQVAVLELLGELRDGLGDAAVGLDAPVAPAVVAAAGDDVAAGVGAGGAHGGVGGVGAGLDDDRLLTAGHHVGEARLELVLDGLHQAEAEAQVHARLDGFVDLRLDVAEDYGPVGAEHVDVLVAVHVEDMAGVAVGDEDRVLADDEVVRPADATHAARRETLRIGEHLHRSGQIQMRGAGDLLGTHADSFVVEDDLILCLLRRRLSPWPAHAGISSSRSPNMTTSAPATQISAPPAIVQAAMPWPSRSSAYTGALTGSR